MDIRDMHFGPGSGPGNLPFWIDDLDFRANSLFGGSIDGCTRTAVQRTLRFLIVKYKFDCSRIEPQMKKLVKFF